LSLFTAETIERVREAAPIVEIVSAYTDLRRAGERWVGLCPFHEERTPSFSVNSQDKLYYCFGCEASGDIFSFVQEKEGLSFPEAVETLAERFGVEVEREEEDPQLEQRRRRRARLHELLERTAGYYSAYLWESPKAQKARDYLAGRGLSEEVLREFGIGYAPSEWGSVLARAEGSGFKVEELMAAGLAQKGKSGGFYDRFRSRITFPVRDPRGRVLGFGARAMGTDQKPKYLNSPEGELYHKGRTLYGIERARGAMGRSGRVVVVEGYTDALAVRQAGIEEVVAVMGTAITPEQLRELSAHAEEVLLALDQDRAGREAMLRAQRVALQSGGRAGRDVRLRVVAMPQGEDPADMLLGGGEEAAARFKGLLDVAVDMPVFHVRKVLDDADLGSPAGRDRALDEVVPVLVGMGETISREELAGEVADRLNADPALVRSRIAAGGRGAKAVAPQRKASDAPREAAPTRTVRPRSNAQEQREKALLAMAVAEPEAGEGYLQRLTDEHLSSPLVVRAKDWLLDHLEAPMEGLPREDEELFGLIALIAGMSETEPASEEAMELNFLELERRALERQIDAAQRAGGAPPVDLQRQRAELAERIAHHPAAVR
jgi:DNA primase